MDARRPGAVVIGSDFRGLGVVRSLARQGIPSVVIDNLPRSAWFSRHVQARFRWDQPSFGPDFPHFLLELAPNHGLEGWVLFPLTDDALELVAKSHALLDQVYRMTTQPWEKVGQALDKRLTNAVAARAGVPVPQTWYPDDADDLADLDIPMPAIVKPACSTALQAAAGRKAYPARTAAELVASYKLAASLIGPEGLMVQELLPGGGENQFSFAALCREGEILRALTARRRRQYPIDFGLGSTFVESTEVPELVPLGTAVIEAMGLSGAVEVEFKRDPRDGLYKLLDVNARVWGWQRLCEDCGLDFPYLQYLESLGLPLPPGRPRYGHRWRRLLTDLPAALAEIRQGQLSPFAYMRSFAGPTSPSVFAFGDPMPAIGDLAVVLRRVLLDSLLSRRHAGPVKRRALRGTAP